MSTTEQGSKEAAKTNGTKTTTSPLSSKQQQQQQVAVNDLTPETSGDDDFRKFLLHPAHLVANNRPLISYLLL